MQSWRLVIFYFFCFPLFTLCFPPPIAFYGTDINSTGLAGALMRLLESVGRRVPETTKMMLTCFTGNQRAAQFYAKLGYSEDEFSPKPRVLRNGTRVESEYVILSKSLS